MARSYVHIHKVFLNQLEVRATKALGLIPGVLADTKTLRRSNPLSKMAHSAVNKVGSPYRQMPNSQTGRANCICSWRNGP